MFRLIFLIFFVIFVAPSPSMTSKDDAFEHFVSILRNASRHYRCDFDQLSFCQFTFPTSWNFQQSVAEFAQKLQQAATDASKVAVAVQSAEISDVDGVHAIKPPSLSLIQIPKANYFPCLKSSRQPSNPVSLKIRWPIYVLNPRPAPPEDITSHTPWEATTTTPRTEDRLISFLNMFHDVESTEPTPLSITTHTIEGMGREQMNLSVHGEYVGYMKMKVRFSGQPNGDQQLKIRLGSNRQIINRYISQSSDWSIHSNRDWSKSNESRIILPHLVWINISMPVFRSRPIYTDQLRDQLPPKSFIIKQTDTWIAFGHDELLLIDASGGEVCLDDFELVVTSQKYDRLLAYTDPTISLPFRILIDQNGLPVTTRSSRAPLSDAISNNNNSLMHLLQFFESSSNRLQSPLAAPILLAFFLAMLVLLLFVTLSLAVVFSYHKPPPPVKFSPHRKDANQVAKTPQPIVYSIEEHMDDENELNAVRQLMIMQDNAGGNGPLSRHSKMQLTSFGDDLSSTNLSLHTDDHSQGDILQTEANQSDTASTSAIQLLRNWNFYKRRHIRPGGAGLRMSSYAGLNLMGSASNQCITRYNSNSARQSMILSVNDNNEFVIVSQLEQNPSNVLPSLSEEDAEATRHEMAVSVGALDERPTQMDNDDETLPMRHLMNEGPPPIYQDVLRSSFSSS